jgi:hypothetical protein
MLSLPVLLFDAGAVLLFDRVVQVGSNMTDSWQKRRVTQRTVKNCAGWQSEITSFKDG